jgi:predicted nucleic acid-binding protein
MRTLFADSAYYIALLSPSDEHHATAVESSRKFTGRIVSTEYVLVEIGSALSTRPDRDLFIELVRDLQTDALTTIVPASSELFEKGLSVFARHRDKEWSLVDCISIAVMKSMRIRTALTSDHHFEQAGFEILLKNTRA